MQVLVEAEPAGSVPVKAKSSPTSAPFSSIASGFRIFPLVMLLSVSANGLPSRRMKPRTAEFAASRRLVTLELGEDTHAT